MPGPGSSDILPDHMEPSGTGHELDLPVIIVRHRPRGLSPLLLPPFFIVIVCALLLGYRSAETDWRGLTWDRLVALWPSPSRAEAAVRPQPENENDSALALNLNS